MAQVSKKMPGIMPVFGESCPSCSGVDNTDNMHGTDFNLSGKTVMVMFCSSFLPIINIWWIPLLIFDRDTEFLVLQQQQQPGGAGKRAGERSVMELMGADGVVSPFCSIIIWISSCFSNCSTFSFVTSKVLSIDLEAEHLYGKPRIKALIHCLA